MEIPPPGFLAPWLVAGNVVPLLGGCVNSTDNRTDRWTKPEVIVYFQNHIEFHLEFHIYKWDLGALGVRGSQEVTVCVEVGHFTYFAQCEFHILCEN